MTINLDLDRLDQQRAARSGHADAPVQRPTMYGAITGQVAVGRYVLQIGDPCGALVREASRAERTHIRPRPTPILARPKLIRGLLDRRPELAAVLSALDAGLPIEMSGERGIGKTAVLRHLAHHPRTASFADGIVYVPARHQPFGDLQQLIFEAFYESDGICKPTEAEIRRALEEKQALFLLDDLDLAQDELEQVLDIAPQSAFAVATRERCLWGEVRSLALKGLPLEDAVLLLEREIERSIEVTERSAAASLCAAIGGHPLRIQQAAAIIREHGMSLERWARGITPESLITELITSVDDKQRRALLALTALPGVPLRTQHVSGITAAADIEPSLMSLVRRGLIVSSQSRHQLADGVGDRLRRTEDLKPWVNRAITYFTAWVERYRRSPDTLLEESEALLSVQQCAADARRWGEVVRLGQLLEGALVVGARWGAWAITLERCVAAAKVIGDRSVEAWALHEMGTRALCLGDPGVARALLNQAVKLREALSDEAAAAASRRNLGFVLAPASDYSRDRPTTPVDVLDLDSLLLRDETQPATRIRKKKSVGVVLLAPLLVAVFGGAFAYWATPAATSWRTWNVASIGSFLQSGLGGGTASTPTTPAPPRPAPELRVLQFSAVPDRIAPGETVRLCYDVANGTRVRIDPDVGELGGVRRNCVSATPMETTNYVLTAQATGGESVRQRVVVQVGTVASRASQPEEPGAVSVRSELDKRAGDPAVPAPQAPGTDRASILIFSPRPGSIATGRPTRLCYAVSDTLLARVEPGVGEINPTPTMSCFPVAPVRTTTYKLTAYGRDGYPVRQQLVIVVR